MSGAALLDIVGRVVGDDTDALLALLKPAAAAAESAAGTTSFGNNAARREQAARIVTKLADSADRQAAIVRDEAAVRTLVALLLACVPAAAAAPPDIATAVALLQLLARLAERSAAALAALLDAGVLPCATSVLDRLHGRAGASASPVEAAGAAAAFRLVAALLLHAPHALVAADGMTLADAGDAGSSPLLAWACARAPEAPETTVPPAARAAAGITGAVPHLLAVALTACCSTSDPAVLLYAGAVVQELVCVAAEGGAPAASASLLGPEAVSASIHSVCAALTALARAHAANATSAAMTASPSSAVTAAAVCVALGTAAATLSAADNAHAFASAAGVTATAALLTGKVTLAARAAVPLPAAAAATDADSGTAWLQAFHADLPAWAASLAKPERLAGEALFVAGSIVMSIAPYAQAEAGDDVPEALAPLPAAAIAELAVVASHASTSRHGEATGPMRAAGGRPRCVLGALRR
jgi:hypothetical protein